MEKCEHKTTAVLADEGNVTIEACTWGCGSILITVTDGNGISHLYTVDELVTMRKQTEVLRERLRLTQDAFRKADLYIGWTIEDRDLLAWQEYNQSRENLSQFNKDNVVTC